MTAADAPLDADRLRPLLTTALFGRVIEAFPTIGSTNDRARVAALAGAPEGLLVMADAQTAGRGRRGRTWLAPPGGAILASVLLRPMAPPAEAFATTMIFALAARAAARAWGVPATLKWPNDVLVGPRKLAGILAEAGTTGERLDYIVVGFGVNVAFDPAALGLEAVATSLAAEGGGAAPDRAAVLACILAEAEARYRIWQAGDDDAVWREWAAALTTPGKPVRVEVAPDQIVSGTALRVERDGALIVRTAEGSETRVVAGTVLAPG